MTVLGTLVARGGSSRHVDDVHLIEAPGGLTSVEATFNSVADQLDQLNLLDEGVSVVQCSDDIVDRVLAGDDSNIIELIVSDFDRSVLRGGRVLVVTPLPFSMVNSKFTNSAFFFLF